MKPNVVMSAHQPGGCGPARISVWIAAILLIGGGYFGQALAQSVEKADTSQQARQGADELQLARESVTKPSKDKTQPRSEESGRLLGDYSVMSSMEIGYRVTDVGGNRNTYLSDVNVRDGLRLLDYSLDVRSLTGHGALFDFLRADISNAGGDQSQYYSFRMDKTRAYKFDVTVRRFDYFRSTPDFARNEHNFDLRQQVSDFNLKLFPQRKVRVNLYYGRSVGKGPYGSTYDYERDEFPVDGQMRWESNDYRIGVDMTIHHWDLFFEQMFRAFKNDSTESLPSLSKGNNPLDPSAIATFLRESPTRGFAEVSRLSLSGDLTRRAHLVLRGLYSNETSDLNEFEDTTGIGSTGTRILDRRFLDTAHSKRPSTTADALFTYDLTDRISISESFRFLAYRITGADSELNFNLLQPVTGPRQQTTIATLSSRFTGVASLWNTIQAGLTTGPKFSASLGLRTTYRDVTLSLPGEDPEKQQNTTNTFLASLRLRPIKRTSFFVNYEEGRTDNAFVSITPLDFRQFRVRTTFKPTETLSVNVSLSTGSRRNPTRFVKNDSNSRVVSTSLFWQPNSRVWVAGGYDFNYFFSNANIVFFVNNALKQGRSIYYSRQNFIFFDSRFALTKRLDLLLAYRFTNDLGAPSQDAGTIGPNDFIATFPLTRHNPEVRLAYRFTNSVTGNLAYRHYSYNERDQFIQDYRANIVTASLRFTF